MWLARTIEIEAVPRGLHLITAEVIGSVPEMVDLSAGLLHVQILHTSAALTLNENADPSVGVDLASWLDEIAPENASLLDPRPRRSRRHAGSRQGRAARPVGHGADRQRQAGARHLAGDPPRRVPRPPEPRGGSPSPFRGSESGPERRSRSSRRPDPTHSGLSPAGRLGRQLVRRPPSDPSRPGRASRRRRAHPPGRPRW